MPSELQSVVFDKASWTLAKAGAWLADRGFNPLGHRVTHSTLQFQISNPNLYLRLTPRRIAGGIQLIMGYRTEELIRKQTVPYVSPRDKIAIRIAEENGKPLPERIKGRLDLATIQSVLNPQPVYERQIGGIRMFDAAGNQLEVPKTTLDELEALAEEQDRNANRAWGDVVVLPEDPPGAPLAPQSPPMPIISSPSMVSGPPPRGLKNDAERVEWLRLKNPGVPKGKTVELKTINEATSKFNAESKGLDNPQLYELAAQYSRRAIGWGLAGQYATELNKALLKAYTKLDTYEPPPLMLPPAKPDTRPPSPTPLGRGKAPART